MEACTSSSLPVASERSSHQMASGFKQRSLDLRLPVSPGVGYEGGFEDALTSNGLHGFYTPCGTPQTPGLSWFSDNGSSSQFKSVFEDWEDSLPGTCADVTIDEDGAQVLHIPFSSLFYEPPTPAQPFNFHPFSDDQYLDAPPSYPEEMDDSASVISTPSEAIYEKVAHAKVSRGTILVVDTTFLSSLANSIHLSALSGSWYSPKNSDPDSTMSWASDARCDPDVPYSAITYSPTDLWIDSYIHPL